MAQSDFGTIVAATKSGSALATDLNGVRSALQSLNSGSTEPSYKAANMPWLDTSTTPWVLKIYDGSQWIRVMIINSSTDLAYALTDNPKLTFPTAGGSATAMTLTLVPALSAYVTGELVTFTAPADNTGALTLDAGAGAKAVRKISGAADVALVAGDVRQKGKYQLVYDSAANSPNGAWVLVQPSLDLSTLSGVIAEAQLPQRLQGNSGGITPGTGGTNGFNAGGSGWYVGAAGASGNPDGTYAYAHAYIKYSSSYGVDDAYAISAAGGVDYHYRRFYDNGTWTSWYRCYDYSSEVQSLVDNALVAIGYGAVATYAWLYRVSGPYAENGNAAGSGLVPAGCIAGGSSSIGSDGYENGGFTRGGGAEAGSWNTRHRNNYAGTYTRIGLWFRYA